MKCPNCHREIIDSAIICPYCNTQFVFSAPVNFNPPPIETNEEDTYKSSDMPIQKKDRPDEVPVEPTQYKVENENDSNQEYMTINGQNVVEDTVDPNVSFSANPIRPEVPRTSSNIVDNPNIRVAMENNIKKPTEVFSKSVDEDKPKVVTINPDELRTIKPDPKVVIPVVQPNYELLKEKEKKKNDLFFIIVTIIGMSIFVGLLIVLMIGNNKNNNEVTTTTTSITTTASSSNSGKNSFFNSPLKVGDTGIASIYDDKNDLYTSVDVTVNRYISGVEASQLHDAYYENETLNSGFSWYALEYNVKFNDLSYLGNEKLSPIMHSMYYTTSGRDFVNYNGSVYNVNILPIYKGEDITNGESATIIELYQVPTNESDYTICFGYIEKTMGCFMPNG